MKTTITRTRKIEGITIPAFIDNLSYHFVDLKVYEDGVIDCWELVDLEVFKRKLDNGKIKVCLPDDKYISSFNLGFMKVLNGNWKYSADSFYEYVEGLVKGMNPEIDNFYRYFPKSNRWYSQSSFYKEVTFEQEWRNPEWLEGDSSNFFYRIEDTYYLIELVVFSDKEIQLQRLPETVSISLESLDEMIAKGEILTEVPDGSRIEIYGLGSFTVSDANFIKVDSKRLEINDKIAKLNGRPTTVEICRSLYKEYEQNPNEKLREELKIAYENIPEHNRMYVGDMDTKDYDVRQIIYGDEDDDSED